MLNLGFNVAANLSLLFTEYPFLDRFAQAKQAGFKWVEIQFPYEFSKEAILTELNKHQLQLALINIPAGDFMQGGDGLLTSPHTDADFLRAIATALDYARHLQVKRVNILAGRFSKRAMTDATLQSAERNRLIARIVYAAQCFYDHGMMPLIEVINPVDMPRFALPDLTQACAVLQSATVPLKLQFDIYHIAKIHLTAYPHLTSKALTRRVLDDLTAHLQDIGHIQFADCPNRHEPSSGLLHFDDIFQALKRLNLSNSDYNEPIVCSAEYIPTHSTPQSLHWLKNLEHFEP